MCLHADGAHGRSMLILLEGLIALLVALVELLGLPNALGADLQGRFWTFVDGANDHFELLGIALWFNNAQMLKLFRMGFVWLFHIVQMVQLQFHHVRFVSFKETKAKKLLGGGTDRVSFF